MEVDIPFFISQIERAISTAVANGIREGHIETERWRRANAEPPMAATVGAAAFCPATEHEVRLITAMMAGRADAALAHQLDAATRERDDARRVVARLTEALAAALVERGEIIAEAARSLTALATVGYTEPAPGSLDACM